VLVSATMFAAIRTASTSSTLRKIIDAQSTIIDLAVDDSAVSEDLDTAEDLVRAGAAPHQPGSTR
jgi:CTP:molybdopterin cytidylyltransferase MocA